MNRTILIFLLLISFFWSTANEELDSLKTELANTEDAETQFDLYLTIADRYALVNSDSSLYYIFKANNYLDKISNKDLIGELYLIKGKYFQSIFKIDSAIHDLHRSHNLFIETDNTDKIILVGNELGNAYFSLNKLDSSAYYYGEIIRVSDSSERPHAYAAYLNNIANIYELQNNKTAMLNNYIRALEIFKLLDEERAIAIAMNNIAIIYHEEMNNLDMAIKYLREAVEINHKVNNVKQLLSNYNNLTLIYRDLDLFDSAKYFIRKAIEIAENSNFPYSLAQSNHNLGSIFLNEKKYDSASISFEKSLEICQQYGITYGTVYNLINLGEVYSDIKEFDKSEESFNNALLLCDSAQLNLEVRSAIIEGLKQLYSEKGDYKSALEYSIQHEAIEDSISKESITNKIQEITAKYESEQKELENQRLKAENINQELIISRQRIIVVISVVSAIIAILIIALILSIRKDRKQRLILLQEKNEKIEEQSEELLKLNRTKDKLFSIISHDLRSPFSALLGFVSIIEEELKNKNYDEAIQFSKHLSVSTKNTYELIDNLLNWSRSQQNKISIDKTEIDLHIICNRIIKGAETSAKEKAIKIQNDILPNTNIYTDKNVLSVIIRNLLSNAIKFSKNGGIIKLEAKANQNLIYISVIDMGVGISSDLIRKLLETDDLFTSLGTGDEEGTGLGLLLVKEFLGYIDGSLYIESTVDKGSTFSFSLPTK